MDQKQLTELPREASVNISSLSLKTANWMKIQLFGFSEQLPLKASSTK
jgi:hypothetical protein